MQEYRRGSNAAQSNYNDYNNRVYTKRYDAYVGGAIRP
jgi:hypothetical protein